MYLRSADDNKVSFTVLCAVYAVVYVTCVVHVFFVLYSLISTTSLALRQYEKADLTLQINIFYRNRLIHLDVWNRRVFNFNSLGIRSEVENSDYKIKGQY